MQGRATIVTKGYRRYRMVPRETWVSENFTQSRNLGFEVFVMGLELFFGWLLGLGVLIFFFGQRASEDFSVFLFHLVFWSRIFQSLRVQLIELDQLIKTEKQDSGAHFILGDPGADLYFSSRHLMNKSAVLWFEFLSKRFGPGPSSVELQVR